MDYVLHGYCGLYCGACPNLLNTRAGVGAEPCHGCKSEQPAGYCASCGMRACAQGKGHEFCSECPEFNTCGMLQDFLKNSNWPCEQIVSNNLELIRQKGLSKWLEMQERRWSCSSCGAPHSWWDETCPRCGRVVASYRMEG